MALVHGRKVVFRRLQPTRKAAVPLALLGSNPFKGPSVIRNCFPLSVSQGGDDNSLPNEVEFPLAGSGMPTPASYPPCQGGSGGAWRGCHQQGCWCQAYRDVFTASPARRHPTREARNCPLLLTTLFHHRDPSDMGRTP